MLITFWLKDLPPAFPKADKVGELVAGFSSAFSTAFPFWFVIEWFQERKRRRHIANIQSNEIAMFILYYNNFISFLLPRNSSLLKKYKDLYSEANVSACYQAVYARFCNGLVEEKGDTDLVMRRYDRLLDQMKQSFDRILPHQLNFSLEFNVGLVRLKHWCEGRSISENEPRTTPIDVLLGITDLYLEIHMLEQIFRRENKMPATESSHTLNDLSDFDLSLTSPEEDSPAVADL